MIATKNNKQTEPYNAHTHTHTHANIFTQLFIVLLLFRLMNENIEILVGKKLKCINLLNKMPEKNNNI